MVLRYTGTLVVIVTAAAACAGRLTLPGAALCMVLGAGMVLCGERAA